MPDRSNRSSVLVRHKQNGFPTTRPYGVLSDMTAVVYGEWWLTGILQHRFAVKARAVLQDAEVPRCLLVGEVLPSWKLPQRQQTKATVAIYHVRPQSCYRHRPWYLSSSMIIRLSVHVVVRTVLANAPSAEQVFTVSPGAAQPQPDPLQQNTGAAMRGASAGRLRRSRRRYQDREAGVVRGGAAGSDGAARQRQIGQGADQAHGRRPVLLRGAPRQPAS
ncbi:hypothetical protein ON010_g10483 [Phytophthora cinnamomi]|nr:hypothetical protein ON010_g10483 [Phytophthora cinnamomi]